MPPPQMFIILPVASPMSPLICSGLLEYKPIQKYLVDYITRLALLHMIQRKLTHKDSYVCPVTAFEANSLLAHFGRPNLLLRTSFDIPVHHFAILIVVHLIQE